MLLGRFASSFGLSFAGFSLAGSLFARLMMLAPVRKMFPHNNNSPGAAVPTKVGSKQLPLSARAGAGNARLQPTPHTRSRVDDAGFVKLGEALRRHAQEGREDRFDIAVVVAHREG